MTDFSAHEDMRMPNKEFPIRVFPCHFTAGTPFFPAHWHKHLELLFFVEGSAVFECNNIAYPVKAGNLLVLNSNDLHSGHSLDDGVSYFCLIIDPSLLQSDSGDVCDVKYMTPIANSIIHFMHKIEHDNAITLCVRQIIQEYEERQPAYELAIKSCIYRLMTLLFRNYVAQVIPYKEFEKKARKLERLRAVFQYITQHYTEDISLKLLAGEAKISVYYLCHLFKEVTGITISKYLNIRRVNRAAFLLKTTNLSVTEVALASGFDDINYFSRSFKRYKKMSPTALRKGKGTK